VNLNSLLSVDDEGFVIAHMTGFDLTTAKPVPTQAHYDAEGRWVVPPAPPSMRMFADFTGLHAKADAERLTDPDAVGVIPGGMTVDERYSDDQSIPLSEIVFGSASQGMDPGAALAALRAEQAMQQGDHQTPSTTFSERELARLRAEEQENGWFTGVPTNVVEAADRFRPTAYPDGNPKTAMGAKKPDLSVVPAVSLLHLATAMMNGSEKYGPYNYRDQPVSARTYIAAALRHLLAYQDGEDFSADTVETGAPVHHLAHVMACCAILLDTTHCDTLNDNRPNVKGSAGRSIELYNRERRLLP
jgi:hypothetical protein